LEEGRYRREHADALHAARGLGIRAVPTIRVGQQLIEGVAAPGTLRRAIEGTFGPRAGA
jgi:predicted DsbA family dithiol-disulfide isomerase